MKKYWVIFSTVFSDFTSYRVQILLYVIQSFVIPTFMLVALSQARSSIVSFSQLIPYYILISVTLPIFRTSIDSELGELTHTGEINNYLVRPIRIYFYFITTEVSKKVATLLIVFPLIVIPIIYFHYHFNLVSAMLSIVISFLVSFNLSYLFGLVMFWVDEFWVIRNVNDVVVTLLGGVVLPYTFFPEWAMRLIRFTPFPYIASLPTRVIQDSALSSDLVLGLFWVIGLYITILFFEKKVIYKYSHTA